MDVENTGKDERDRWRWFEWWHLTKGSQAES